MKVELDFPNKKCRVTQDSGDKKISESGWIRTYGGDPNSTLFYRIQQVLNKHGYDMIKKRMTKDGHLTSDERQYIRTRKKGKGAFCIYDNLYYIRNALEEYNKGRQICLDIEALTNIPYLPGIDHVVVMHG